MERKGAGCKLPRKRMRGRPGKTAQFQFMYQMGTTARV
jgi:hypothetical protein